MQRLQIVAISGPVGAGKSTLARGLTDRYDGRHLSTKELIRTHARTVGDVLPDERRALQDYGDTLDAQTDGSWIARAAAQYVSKEAGMGLVIVDAVRIQRQIDALREAFGADVVHLHLYSSEEVLARRYANRGGTSGLVELSSYADVAANATEAAVHELIRDADVAINTERSNVEDVLIRAAAALMLLPAAGRRLVDVLVGGQYGSEGKGNIAFYLAGEYEVLVRVGGPNAGHRVPLPTPYTHRSLPSGTMANPDASLVIGPGATLDVDVLLAEIAACAVEATRLTVDPQAMIIEDADRVAELGLVASIGSTGKGGGSAAARRITGRHSEPPAVPVRLARDVPELEAYVRPSADILEDVYRGSGRILLEGTQGTALSLFHGHYPYVTSRDTTTAACLTEAGIGPHRLRRVILVTRTYPIRVESPDSGTSGPMSQEISYDLLAERSGISSETLVSTEKGSVMATQRRFGEFDWRLLHRAVELNGATDVALTFTDYLDAANQNARRFEQLTPDTIRFIEEVERVAGVPVSLVGTRFDVRSVIDRRRW
jgi:adenylosuccinate synthase